MARGRDGEPPKRILVVAYIFLPDPCGGGPINADMCRELADLGLDVTVRCPYPFYPEWHDKSGQNGWTVRRETLGNVKVERHGLYIPSNPRSMKQRMLHDASFFLSLARSLFRGRFDAVMVYCPLAGAVGYAAMHRAVRRCPVWLNVQDLPADAAASSGIAKPGFAQRLLNGVQSRLFNATDVWSSISPTMMEKLRSIRKHRQPVVFLPNWLHTSMAEAITSHPSKEGRAPGRPLKLFYSGNIGAKQGLLDFCRSVQQADVPFLFRIHGDGAEAVNVRNWIEQTGDRRFEFGPLLDEPGYVDNLVDADFYVITEKQGGGASFFPSKMIPGMTSGTPILAVSDPDSPLGREMANHRPGPWFSWNELDRLPVLLETAGDNRGEFFAWQRNAARRAEAYERRSILDALHRMLLELMDGRRPESLDDGGFVEALPAAATPDHARTAS